MVRGLPAIGPIRARGIERREAGVAGGGNARAQVGKFWPRARRACPGGQVFRLASSPSSGVSDSVNSGPCQRLGRGLTMCLGLGPRGSPPPTRIAATEARFLGRLRKPRSQEVRRWPRPSSASQGCSSPPAACGPSARGFSAASPVAARFRRRMRAGAGSASTRKDHPCLQSLRSMSSAGSRCGRLSSTTSPSAA